MTELDISTQISSRICHDLISPVGAIGNGVELLAEISPGSEELDLIGQSAATASATLQFYRLAFSAATGEDLYSLPRVHTIASTMFERRERSTLVWPAPTPGAETSRAAARIICNMLLMATSSLPRGGTITVALSPENQFGMTVTAEGPLVKFSDEAGDWLTKGEADRPPSPAEVHYITSHRHARDAGARISFAVEDTVLTLTCSSDG